MASHIETTTSNSESISVNGENKVSLCEAVVSHIEVLSLPYVRRKTHILSANVLLLLSNSSYWCAKLHALTFS